MAWKSGFYGVNLALRPAYCSAMCWETGRLPNGDRLRADFPCFFQGCYDADEARGVSVTISGVGRVIVYSTLTGASCEVTVFGAALISGRGALMNASSAIIEVYVSWKKYMARLEWNVY